MKYFTSAQQDEQRYAAIKTKYKREGALEALRRVEEDLRGSHQVSSIIDNVRKQYL